MIKEVHSAFSITVALTILQLSIQFAYTQQLSPDETTSLLAKIRARTAASPDVQTDFQQEQFLRLMRSPVKTSGHVWFQTPNKFRREVTGNSPSISVSDGQQLWIFYPNFKRAERYSLGQQSPVDAVLAAINTALNLENVEKSFSVSGSKIANGYQLQLSPRSSSMKRIFQKFDLQLNSDLHVVHTEMTQPNDDRVITTYSNHRDAPIPPATFHFTLPPGTEITMPLGR